jgi:AcrR family transcriptional regulator
MPGRRRADAVRSAEALLAAARELVAERGPDAALDEVARRAGVGNATLYRHFPTRGDLLVAVYADEVDRLCARGAELLAAGPPGAALFTWLDEFVGHVAAKRALAHAATEGAAGGRAARFEAWHRSMHDTAGALLRQAIEAGAVRAGVTAADLLTLANGIVLAEADVDRARRLLALARTGLAPG